MRTFAIALLAGAGALSVGSAARASDIYTTSEYSNPDLVQNVRMVCDDSGRCYRTRGGSRVIVREGYRNSYNSYEPRARYYERRTYRDYDDGPSVGIRAPASAWASASAAIAGKRQCAGRAAEHFRGSVALHNLKFTSRADRPA